jgi:hypothetical protein
MTVNLQLKEHLTLDIGSTGQLNQSVVETEPVAKPAFVAKNVNYDEHQPVAAPDVEGCINLVDSGRCVIVVFSVWLSCKL